MLCLFTYVNAAPLIGTGALLYEQNNASDVLLSKLDESKINDSNYKLGVRRIILTEVVKQMAGFQSVLDSTLTESGYFSVYDATPIVQNWKNTTPKLLNTYYKTISVPPPISFTKNKSESQVISQSPVSTRKFILLGWVDSIYERENRTPIAGTDKTALIYNLDIRCEYRLINMEDNHVVAVLVGAGHGGIARILGNGQLPINYDAHLIVSDMFYSLAYDVRHSLRVRQDEYIKKKNNATKIDLSKPQQKK